MRHNLSLPVPLLFQRYVSGSATVIGFQFEFNSLVLRQLPLVLLEVADKSIGFFPSPG